MPDILRKSFTSAVIKSDDTQGIVEAIVNTTGGDPDRQNDVVVPGAWKKAIAAINRKAPKVVWHHENGLTSDRFTVVGKVLGAQELMPGDALLPPEIKSAGRGALIAKMQFNLATQAGKEAYSNVAGGYVDEWSVGFLPEQAQYNKEADYNEIKSAFPLLEISPVLMGASPLTATLSAKSDDAPQQKARFQMDDGKYPINNCSDVSDAWGLRGRSTTHSREQVERHVRHAASELGCNGPWNGKTADLEEALQTASDLIDQITDEVSVADTPDGTATKRTDDDIETLESISDRSSSTVPNSTVPDGAAEPVHYLKVDEAREMFTDVLKAALRDRDSVTDLSTRPDNLNVVTAPAEQSNLTEELKAKGYFPPVAKRDFERPEGFNINRYPRGDIDNFSVARYSYAKSLAQAGLNEYAVTQIAPWEKQYIEAGMKDVLINPVTKANMGDMVSGQDGGFLAPEQWNQQLYDLLYPSSIVSQLPVTIQTVPTRVVHWPVLTNNITVYYVGENAALTASSPQFRQITATMRKQAVLVYLSNELIRDSSPQADAVLRSHAATEMAIDQDAAILAGNGTSGGPIGLLSMSGLTTSSGPAHLAYTDLVKGIFQVETLNASTITRVGQSGCTGIVANPVLKKQIASMVDSNLRPLWDFSLRNVNISGSPAGNGQMPNPGAPLSGFLNVPNWVLSNNQNTTAGASPLPLTEGSQNIYFGDWRHLIVAQRMDIEFMASNVAGNTFANDQTAIRLIRRYDVVCPHPEAFFVLKSVTS